VVKGELMIMMMNDVHLDLNYDPYGSSKSACQLGKLKDDTLALYGRIGCDSPYALFKSGLDKMKEVNPKPDVILVPGDMVTHAIPKNNGIFDSNTYKELRNVIENYTMTVSGVFPDTPVVFTLGNDDFAINYNVPNNLYKYNYYKFTYKQFITNIKANKFAVVLYYIYRTQMKIK
jgi:hypothetical protein